LPNYSILTCFQYVFAKMASSHEAMRHTSGRWGRYEKQIMFLSYYYGYYGWGVFVGWGGLGWVGVG
jgi:hypothetical protein